MTSEDGAEPVTDSFRARDEWSGWAETASASRLVGWALKAWGRGVAVGTAFQAEGIVLIHLAWSIDPQVQVFTLDTGRLPPETHEVMERVRERFGIEIEVYMPDPEAVRELVYRRGPNLFLRSIEDRLACCQIRKVEPMVRALRGRQAWLTGLRREQSPQRQEIRPIERDPRSGVVKINPLLHWTESEVWDYIRAHDLPYHPLYDQGYRSIGCAPCTRPTAPHESPRAGRWWWEEDQQPAECGLHQIGSTDAQPSRLEAGLIRAMAPGDER